MTDLVDWADLAALNVLARVIDDQYTECDNPVNAALFCYDTECESKLFARRCADALRDAHLDGFLTGVAHGRRGR